MKTWCLAAAVAVLLTGCAHEVGFNAAYVHHRPPRSSAAGKLLLLMPERERASVYTGTADSRRGGDRTLVVPMGAIVEHIGKTVLGSCFDQGAVIGDRLAAAKQYTAAVKPAVVSFVYRYVDVPRQPWEGAADSGYRKTAKWPPMLIVPQVEVKLAVKVYDHRGRRVLTKTYSSGTVSGKGYFVSNAPAQAVDKLLHQTLHRLMMQAAADVNVDALGGVCDLHRLPKLPAGLGAYPQPSQRQARADRH